MNKHDRFNASVNASWAAYSARLCARRLNMPVNLSNRLTSLCVRSVANRDNPAGRLFLAQALKLARAWRDGASA